MLNNTPSQSKNNSYLPHYVCQTVVIRTESSLETHPDSGRLRCNLHRNLRLPYLFRRRGKIKTVIKETFQEKFEKQAENITNLISGNFKLTMQEIHGLKNEISDLRKSLEFTQNGLEEKVDSVEKRMEKLGSAVQEVT